MGMNVKWHGEKNKRNEWNGRNGMEIKPQSVRQFILIIILNLIILSLLCYFLFFTIQRFTRHILRSVIAGRVSEDLVPLPPLHVPLLAPCLVAALAGAPVLRPPVILLGVQASHNTLAKTSRP